MATASTSGTSHLGLTENQKRWLVAGIALNKILIPGIRPFVEQEIKKGYNFLKANHNIHAQSFPHHLPKWPGSTCRDLLKYENINRNDTLPKLKKHGKYLYDFSAFNYQVTSHVDFARLYVQNYMAHFTAFDDYCDASAVLTLLVGVPVFSAAVQTAADDVRKSMRNEWAHCAFSNWDQAKFHQSFHEMQHLVRDMGLPTADEGKLLGELKDWETKGVGIRSETKGLNARHGRRREEKRKVQHELQNVATTLEEMEQRMQRVEIGQRSLEHHTGILEGKIEDFEGDVNQRMERLESSQQSTESRTMLVEDRVHHLQGDLNQKMEKLESSHQSTESRTLLVEEKVHHLQGDVNQRMERLESNQQSTEDKVHHLQGDVQQRVERIEVSQQSTESRTMLVEHKVHHLQEQVEDLTLSMESNVSPCQDNPMQPDYPEKLVELIRRDYKGAVLCPFPWCEDELQLELPNVFTRLKIVNKKKERARQTDDIVNMTDVFKPRKECNKPRVVLIEGQPGMGKTTYCQKLAYDWSVEDISPEASFPKVEILLMLKCRDMKTSNIEEAIDDQLLPQDVDKKEKENFFQFIRCNQSRILLVLDGLDELPHDLFQSLLPLIQGKVFSNTYLMLTARHEAGMEVRRYCDTLLEIVGYTRKDADSYITKYFSNHQDPSLANTMIEKLKNDSHLRELTANPLNTALLCLVFEDTRGKFPLNKTKLYHELVSCALRRDFAKKNKRVPLDPVESCTDKLNQLGKMALEALKEDRMYFSENEMKCHSTDFLQLCFLSREASVSKIRPTPCYAFTHKTFQEYFAAFHVAHELFTGDKAGRDTLLAQLSPVDKYWQVWEFLFSMVVSKSHDDAIYLLSRLCACLYHERSDKITETKSDAEVNVQRICADPSYDWVKDIERRSKDENAVQSVLAKTFNLIAECEYGENELKDYQKKMVKTLARCLPLYNLNVSKNSRGSLVINEYLKANCTLAHLRLEGDLDELGLAAIKVVLQSDHNLAHLNLFGSLHYNFLGMMTADRRQVKRSYLEIATMQASGAIALAKLLDSNRTLTHLNLSWNWILDPGALALAHILQLNHTLTHLNLESALIFNVGAKALAGALLSNCTLTHLSLPENYISDLGAEAIATGLKFNCALLHLDLTYNWIGNRGVTALARSLEQGPGMDSNVTLTYLDLHHHFGCGERTWPFDDCYHDVPVELIGESGALALARALRTNCSLTYLDLQENAIGDSGAAAIGEALQSNRNLTHLYLNSNKIGDRGAVALAKALQSEDTFTRSNLLEQNSVEDSGVVELHFALVKALRSTSGTQLTRLDLHFNKISSSGATVLADALQFNYTLERLDLGFNKLIDCSGAVALAKALRTNRSLTHLDLRGDNIGDSGATEFTETLNFNYTLTFLDLSLNPIGELGAENLRQADQSICALKYSEPEKH
ncbi:hypothetical protein ACROYT_G002732 [Oculina patagonica]